MADKPEETTKMKPEDVDDFDELLEDALHDFDNPNLVQPALSQAQKQSGATSSSAQAHAPGQSKSASATAYDILRENASNEDLLSQLGNLDLDGISDEDFSKLDMNDIVNKLTKDFSGLDKTVQGFLEPSADDDKDPELKKIKQELRNLSAKVDQVPDDSEGVKELGLTLAQTLKTLNESVEGASAVGPEGDDAMLPFMENLMQTLLSKDVIYPSLKTIRDNYPGWLQQHASSLSEAEQNRHYSQLDIVRQVCHEYEVLDQGQAPPQDKFVTILELMQKMQELGQPPEELLGDDDQLTNALPQCPQM